MLLYHGTSYKYLKSILRNGLCPRGKRKSNWPDHTESRNDCVYLTNAYAPYFCWQEPGQELGIVVELLVDPIPDLPRNREILVSPKRLLPDEDAIFAANKQDFPESYHPQLLKSIRDSLHLRNSGEWEKSLNLLGTCAHLGKIAPECIRRIAIIPKEYFLHWDASITPMNFNLLGSHYQAQTARLFGDEWDGPVSPFHPDRWKIPMDHKVLGVNRDLQPKSKGFEFGRQITRIVVPDERKSYLDLLNQISSLKEEVET
jgi:hypothetical protein